MSKQSQRGILSRLHLPLAAAASLLLALGACSGDVASPAARQPVDVSSLGPAFGRSGGGSGKNLHSNRDRYRNRGRGHGYGRYNDIDVEGMALLGADRVTRLTLSTGTVDPLAAGDGSITKVQVKAYTPDGQKLYVNNFNHLTPAGIQKLSLNGLAAGSLLYIRAHVRGARTHKTNCGCDDRGRGNDRDDRDDRGSSRGRGNDRDDHGRDDNRWDRRDNNNDGDCDDDPRTDVVTLVDTVKAAAALNVDVQLPPTATVGLPVVITGVVSEINGDVGTRANCELWVNGRLVDSAAGIWVDAGDAVSCAFSYTFPTTGTQNVEVRVKTDGGGSSSNQGVVTDGGTLNVGNPFTTGYSAQVEDRSVSNTTVFSYTWSKPDGSHKEYSNTEVNTERNQTMNVQGTIERAAVFPLARVSLAMESNGVEWQTEQWEGLAATAATDGRQCISRDMPAYGATFFLCNGLLGGASWGYQRFAGNVTYHSHGYSNTFDGIAGVQDLYSWNDNYTTYAFGGQVRALGSALLMRLTITDAAGSVNFTPAVPVSPFANVLGVTPEACVTTRPEGLEGGSLTECRSARSDDAGWRGSSTG